MQTSTQQHLPSLNITVSTFDFSWQQEAQNRQNSLTKPQASLGQLEALAIQLATLQRTHRPTVDHAHAFIFAADHPVVCHGTSAFPMEVTAAMVSNFLSGGAASSVLAQMHQIPLTVIDVGVDTDYPVPQVSGDRYQKHELTAGDISVEASLSHQNFTQAIYIGRECVAKLDDNVKLLILGEMGIGNTTSSSAVASALITNSLDDLIGRGTGISDEAIHIKKQIVQKALQRWSQSVEHQVDNVAEIMRHLAGREMVSILGAMLESVQRGIPILVDGFIISVVALALVRMYPQARNFLIFSHRSQEKGHQKVLAALKASPLLSLDLRLGEASGALTAYPLLKAACALHSNMATFEEAAVPNKEESL